MYILFIDWLYPTEAGPKRRVICLECMCVCSLITLKLFVRFCKMSCDMMSIDSSLRCRYLELGDIIVK